MKVITITTLPDGCIAKVEIPYMLFGVVRLKKVFYVRTVEDSHKLFKRKCMATYYRTLDDAYAAALAALNGL